MNAPPVDHKDGAPDQRYKADVGKRDWTLIPQGALCMILTGLEYGAKKYAARSWRTVPNARERYLKSLARHTQQVLEAVEVHGIDRGLLWSDEESNLPHLVHLGDCAIILIDLALQARK